MSAMPPYEVTKVTVYKDIAGEWRWTEYAGNNEPVADSNEGYEDKSYAVEVGQMRAERWGAEFELQED